ncbi:MAG: zinc metalloprotease HtpX [Candidatus Bathyarchaeota archaeon]|nr:MAG: zinc metalloprotease HtpX [Candidatus Bathyarchaeota archaeon]
MIQNLFKTGFLFFVLTGFLMGLSYILGFDPLLALFVAGGLNFLVYFFSDKIVLRMTGAKEISSVDAPRLHRVLESLASRAGIPQPKIYIVENDVPNAFATGRDPGHASVCVHTGLMNTLNDQEIEGVLSHELSHVRNYDTLTMVVAATLAGAITLTARMFYYSSFGYGGRDNRRGNALGGLMMIILAPLAASLVQLAISRTREYAADESGALLSGKPLALASALEKISYYASQHPMTSTANPALSSLYIINPFKGGSFAELFLTHPPTQKRTARLKELDSHMRPD